jgi:hypothetical protein
VKQPRSDEGFERLDLVADRRLGDVQLLCRPLETHVTGGCLERADRVKRWQITVHRT